MWSATLVPVRYRAYVYLCQSFPFCRVLCPERERCFAHIDEYRPAFSPYHGAKVN